VAAPVLPGVVTSSSGSVVDGRVLGWLLPAPGVLVIGSAEVELPGRVVTLAPGNLVTLTSGVDVLGSGEVVLRGVRGVGTVEVIVVVPPGEVVVTGVSWVGSSIPVPGGVGRSAGIERSKIAGTAAAGAVSGGGPGGGSCTW